MAVDLASITTIEMSFTFDKVDTVLMTKRDDDSFHTTGVRDSRFSVRTNFLCFENI